MIVYLFVVIQIYSSSAVFFYLIVKLSLEKSDEPKLSIELDKDGIAQCLLEDLKANCSVRKIYVNIANQDNQITLIVYHNVLDALADCICKYDVNFKISKLTSGDYNLKVYYARPNMKYDESNIAYNGQVNIAQNKKVSVTFNPEVGLPEN